MAVTAYAAKGDEERIRDAGAEGYVSKPISVVKFVEAVRGLLKERAAMPKVESSAVDRAEYDEESATLDLWYKDGDRYSYFEVPRERYEALLAAESDRRLRQRRDQAAPSLRAGAGEEALPAGGGVSGGRRPVLT